MVFWGGEVRVFVCVVIVCVSTSEIALLNIKYRNLFHIHI